MFKTRITELMGIEYPIIQSGMQWISRPELVAATSNAGGLGVLNALTCPTPKDLTVAIKKVKSLTSKPFGVNVTLMPTLRKIDYAGYIDALIDEGVKIVETSGRNPEPYMPRLKSAGVKVMHKCTAVRFALTAERVGCDAISMVGFETAGHPGEDDITSLILIPRTVDAVNVPVVAAGGFGDGRGLVAALALGAEGVDMGTRFVATQESPVHPNVKQRLVEASERDTILLLRSLHNTSRVLRNSVAEKVAEMEKQGATLEQLAPLISGLEGRELLEKGNMEQGLLSCGQVVGLIHGIPTVKELIDSIVAEAKQIMGQRLPGIVSGKK